MPSIASVTVPRQVPVQLNGFVVGNGVGMSSPLGDVDDVDEPQAHAHPTIIPIRVSFDRTALPSFRLMVDQWSIS
jgi:hypothetical protein